jgi:hypothetical protein
MTSSSLIALIVGLIVGLLLGWIFFRGKKQDGDLSIEGEGALKATADELRAENQSLKSRLASAESETGELKSQLSSSSETAEASDASDETYALEWRNRYLAARVKYLEGRLADVPAPKAKAKPKAKKAAAKTAAVKTKKAPAKKAAAKKPAAKKAKASASKTKLKPGPKPGTKRGALTATGAPRKKPGPKPGATRVAKPKLSEAEAKLEKYYANVLKYDPKAKKPAVANIVKYCGIALKSRDGSLVACSDESELQTVADGFVTKKLGKKTGQIELVKDICAEMKGERFKSRVTFYYLAAKKARKMTLFN